MIVRLACVFAVVSVVVSASKPVHAAPFASSISEIANEVGVQATSTTNAAHDLGSSAGNGVGSNVPDVHTSATVPEPTELLLLGAAAVILGRGLRKRIEQAKHRAAAIPRDLERNDH
jgi:hypothetical protein